MVIPDYLEQHQGSRIPDALIVLALFSLNGEITPNMRKISLGYTGKTVCFRYFTASEPTEVDRECAEVTALNFDAGLSHKLDELDIQFVVTSEPFGKLEGLDCSLFSRWEKSVETPEELI